MIDDLTYSLLYILGRSMRNSPSFTIHTLKGGGPGPLVCGYVTLV